MSKLNEALQRISAIKWNEIGKEIRKSHAELIKEYLRRGSLFLHSFSKTIKLNYVFNASEIAGKSLELDLNKLCPELKNLKPFPRELCRAYIEWSYLIDCNDNTAVKFCDIYEPIIKFYERGGEFYRHHGDICLGKYMFSPGCWDVNEYEPIDICDNILDDLDREPL